jgi:hypothetical protein
MRVLLMCSGVFLCFDELLFAVPAVGEPAMPEVVTAAAAGVAGVAGAATGLGGMFFRRSLSSSESSRLTLTGAGAGAGLVRPVNTTLERLVRPRARFESYIREFCCVRDPCRRESSGCAVVDVAAAAAAAGAAARADGWVALVKRRLGGMPGRGVSNC